MYTYKRKVTYSEVACDGMADAAQIVRYFQDCSTMQSESLGMGIDYLEQHSHVWMLTAWQIQFNRRPKLGEDFVTGTWAYDFDAMYGYRNFILKGPGDETLAVANSIWVLINTLTGRPEKLTMEAVEGYGSEERYPMDYAPRRIKLPKEWEEKKPFTVKRADLDTNCHVNNACYISMALEYVKPEDNIRQVRVEYKKAALLGDRIYPKVSRKDNTMTVALCSEDGQIFVAVEMLMDLNI